LAIFIYDLSDEKDPVQKPAIGMLDRLMVDERDLTKPTSLPRINHLKEGFAISCNGKPREHGIVALVTVYEECYDWAVSVECPAE
jgi:hypothetical protein